MVTDKEHPVRGSPALAGHVYWITGLPGSGKTTLAHALVARIATMGRSIVELDGDRIRAILGDCFGYGQADRRALAQAYGRLCKEIADQGPDVVCATVSMFHDVRSWNRANIGRYVEVYLAAPIEVLSRRHPQGLYGRALAGQLRDVPGIDLAYEEPEAPDVTLDAAQAADGVAADLFAFLDAHRMAA